MKFTESGEKMDQNYARKKVVRMEKFGNGGKHTAGAI